MLSAGVIFSGCAQSQKIQESGTAKEITDRGTVNTTVRKNYIKNEIDSFNSFYQDQRVKDYKYAQMKTSPFAFYRATAHLYYKDLVNGIIPVPSQWKNTADISPWIQGDLHIQNLGHFENNKGEIVFDLNDFDESYIAPFYWDLIRFTASVYLIKDEVGFNFSSSEQDELALCFLEEYQNNLTDGNNQELTISNLSGFLQDQAEEIMSEQTQQKLLDKWTVIKNGKRVFDFTNEKLEDLTSSDEVELASWNTYLSDNSSFVSKMGNAYFTVKSKAKRLYSGLGSLGVKKYYVLLEGASSSQNDDIILEVKEERQPSLFLSGLISSSLYSSYFSTHGKRSVTASRAMLKNAEDFLGIMVSSNSSYQVKKISSYKFGFEPADFKSKSDLKNFLKYAALALANAHNRSDSQYNPLYIPYVVRPNILNAIKVWSSAKTTLRSLAKNYAAQVKVDYSLFKQ